MRKLQLRYRKLMHAPNRTLFMMDFVCMAILILFFLPIFNYAFLFSLKLWGQSYLTYENAISYITYPTTLLLFIITLAFLTHWMLLRHTALIHSINCVHGKRQSLVYLLYISFVKVFRLMKPRNVLLPLFTFLQTILAGLPLLVVLILTMDLQGLSGEYDGLLIRIIVLLFLLLLTFIGFRGLFTLHFCVNGQQSFFQALEQSKALLRGRQRKTFLILLLHNIAFSIVSYFLYYVLFSLVALFVFLFTEKSLVISVFLSVYAEISIPLLLVYHMIALITNANIVTALFEKYREKDYGDAKNELASSEEQLLPRRRTIFATKGFIAFVLIAGLINFYMTVRNDAFVLQDSLSGIKISSHRGNSFLAPENTLPAIEYAIDADSDYCEIDIRQTKDGVIVLLHDESLLRTAGLDQTIQSLLYEEIAGLDVGSWFSLDYIRTSIPTLEEVLIQCKGRIKLNIEIKSKNFNDDFAEKLVALINQYDYVNQCLISSTNHNILLKVKELNPELKTGLIIAAAFGDFYNKEMVDFLSIRSRYITRNVVENAHKVGKEVHAWTVNSPKEIERMKSLGVDCIITDNPVKTREILLQDDRNRTFIQLLKQLMKSHSFTGILP